MSGDLIGRLVLTNLLASIVLHVDFFSFGCFYNIPSPRVSPEIERRRTQNLIPIEHSALRLLGKGIRTR